MTTISEALFCSAPMGLQPDWIDYNGHLNMAYYHVLFDRGVDGLFETLGLGPTCAQERGFTTYVLEVHVCYLREIHLGAEIFTTIQLLEHDEKRLHLYQELRHPDGWIAATSESLTASVDMRGPRVAPFPADIQEAIKTFAERQKHLPRPERAGRSIRLRPRAERPAGAS